jgi:hypothetical protein
MIRQDRQEITADVRNEDGWWSQVLNAADELALPTFGLVCQVRDLYRRTPIT